MSDFVSDDRDRDQQVDVPNPGLSAAFPVVSFGRNISPDDFNRRDPIAQGHQRRSPGDGVPQRGPNAIGKDAEMAPPENLGPGILPTKAITYRPDPIRAADFARSIGEPHDDGPARPSPGNVVRRGPISPEQALGIGYVRDSTSMLQEDRQPSPMRGNQFPDTAGREGNPNGDAAGHVRVSPPQMHSAAIGPGIFKEAGRVARGHVSVESPAIEVQKTERAVGRVTAMKFHSNPIARTIANFAGTVAGRAPKEGR